MTSAMVEPASPLREVEREKSLDLDDVFGGAQYLGKDFCKGSPEKVRRSTRDRSRSRARYAASNLEESAGELSDCSRSSIRSHGRHRRRQTSRSRGGRVQESSSSLLNKSLDSGLILSYDDKASEEEDAAMLFQEKNRPTLSKESERKNKSTESKTSMPAERNSPRKSQRGDRTVDRTKLRERLRREREIALLTECRKPKSSNHSRGPESRAQSSRGRSTRSRTTDGGSVSRSESFPQSRDASRSVSRARKPTKSNSDIVQRDHLLDSPSKSSQAPRKGHSSPNKAYNLTSKESAKTTKSHSLSPKKSHTRSPKRVGTDHNSSPKQKSKKREPSPQQKSTASQNLKATQEGNPERPCLGLRKPSKTLHEDGPSPLESEHQRPSLGLRQPSLQDLPLEEQRPEDLVPERSSLGLRGPSLSNLLAEDQTANETSPKRLQLREPSRRNLSLEEQSPRSLTEAENSSWFENASKGSGGSKPLGGATTEDDDESDDESTQKSVLQFDPTQRDNVYRVRQVAKTTSNYEVDNLDGSHTSGHIAEICDPLANAQRLRGTDEELPIFEFLDSSKSTSLGRSRELHEPDQPSGGEEEKAQLSGKSFHASGLDAPSGGEEEKDNPLRRPQSFLQEGDSSHNRLQGGSSHSHNKLQGSSSFNGLQGGSSHSQCKPHDDTRHSNNKLQSGSSHSHDKLQGGSSHSNNKLEGGSSHSHNNELQGGPSQSQREKNIHRKDSSQRRKAKSRKPPAHAKQHRVPDEEGEQDNSQRKTRSKHSRHKSKRRSKQATELPLPSDTEGETQATPPHVRAALGSFVRYPPANFLDDPSVATELDPPSVATDLEPPSIVTDLEPPSIEADLDPLGVEGDTKSKPRVKKKQRKKKKKPSTQLPTENHFDGAGFGCQRSKDWMPSSPKKLGLDPLRPSPSQLKPISLFQPDDAESTTASLPPIVQATAWDSDVELSPTKKNKRKVGIGLGIGKYFGRNRRNSPGTDCDTDRDDASVGSSISRVFRNRKKHQLLGDDDSLSASDVPF